MKWKLTKSKRNIDKLKAKAQGLHGNWVSDGQNEDDDGVFNRHNNDTSLDDILDFFEKCRLPRTLDYRIDILKEGYSSE